MANKNFEVKHGLSVGGTERITSAGAGSFTDLTLSGDLNITGDVNSVSVTDLDVTDKTITLGKGQAESASGGSGIVIDGSNASMLWDESNGEFDFNNPLSIVNSIGGDTVLNLTGSYGSGNNAALLGFARSGGAVSGDIRYVDATTDMEIGTGTAHAFSLKTSGTRRLTVDASGDVAIGTTGGNGRRLEVATSNDYVAKFESTDAAAAIIIEDSNSGDNHNRIGVSTNDMHFSTANSERMRINSSGNVGIGTSSPIAPLHVSGNAVIETGSPDLYLATTSASHTNWRIAAQEVVNQGFEIASGTTSAGSNAVADTYTTRLTILNSGNVGIGTTTPTKLLQLRDTTQTNQSIHFGPHGAAYGEINYNSTGLEHLYIDCHGTTSGYGNIVFRTGPDPAQVFKLGADGYATFTSTRNEYAMELNSAGTRAGLVLNKPGTSSVMGSLLMLSDETYRLGTASYYHVRMDQSGNTYMGNTGTTRFLNNGNFTVNHTGGNAGITSGSDIRAMGPAFANDANSFTMSQESAGAVLAARGANTSTRGNIQIGVSVSTGGGFKQGLVIDNLGRSTTPENPAFRCRATQAQTLNSGWQQVGYDTVVESRGTGYTTSNSRFTAPVAGWYQFNASWTANNNSDTDGTLSICINGSYSDLVSSVSMPNTGGSYDGHVVSGCCYLDVNDYVDVRRYSTVATTTRTADSYGGWFSGFLIG